MRDNKNITQLDTKPFGEKDVLKSSTPSGFLRRCMPESAYNSIIFGNILSGIEAILLESSKLIDQIIISNRI